MVVEPKEEEEEDCKYFFNLLVLLEHSTCVNDGVVILHIV